MNRLSKALIVVAVAAFGLWGCSQAANNPAGQSERLHALESKCTKLEDDYKAVAKERADARSRAAALEEENAQLEAKRQKAEEQGKQLAQERDDLQQQLKSRTSERERLQARCDRLKKGLQELIGQDDALAQPGGGAPAGGGQ